MNLRNVPRARSFTGPSALNFTTKLCALAASTALLAASSGCSGFGTSGLSVEDPQLEVSLSLDAPRHHVGESVYADIEVKNVGPEPVSIPRPGRTTMMFHQLSPDSPDPLVLDFAASPGEPIEFIVLAPEESVTRRFLLPLGARFAGTYQLFGVYRPEADEGIESATPVASNTVPNVVLTPATFERDSHGYISEDDAKRVAVEFFGQPAGAVTARFTEDVNVKLGQWLVTVQFQSPDDKGRAERSCLVNALVGKVHSVVNDTALESARKSSPETGG